MVLIDDPRWPAHGRLWAHLVSDDNLDELHAFAAANGIPARGFDFDHYDVPAERHAALVAAGAVHVDGHELVKRLIDSGLRVTARERSARVSTLRQAQGTAARPAGSADAHPGARA